MLPAVPCWLNPIRRKLWICPLLPIWQPSKVVYHSSISLMDSVPVMKSRRSKSSIMMNWNRWSTKRHWPVSENIPWLRTIRLSAEPLKIRMYISSTAKQPTHSIWLFRTLCRDIWMTLPAWPAVTIICLTIMVQRMQNVSSFPSALFPILPRMSPTLCWLKAKRWASWTFICTVRFL